MLANNELLLFLLSAFAHCTLLRILYVFSLCAISEDSPFPTDSSPVVPPIASGTPHQTHLPPHEDHVVTCGLYCSCVLSSVIGTHTILDECDVPAVLPCPDSRNIEHCFRIRVHVGNLTSDLLTELHKLNENVYLHLNIFLAIHSHRSAPRYLFCAIKRC